MLSGWDIKVLIYFFINVLKGGRYGDTFGYREGEAHRLALSVIGVLSDYDNFGFI